ncbi:MAG: hypothetical protein U0Q16_18220 [Bryobacteraceae bacterium]
MKPPKPAKARGGIQLIEESVDLLRDAPAEAWAFYLAGVIPFAAGLLWFAADMSRSLYARQRVFEYSLGITLLFVWKQICESWFLERLHAVVTGARASAPLWRISLRQAAVQPWSLLGLVLATLATVPLPHAVFFFRGFSLAAVIEPERPMHRSWALARTEPGQAWVLFAVLAAFSLLLYLNLLIGVVATLMLSKSVFGVEHLLTDPMVLLRSSTVHFGILLAVWACGDLVLGAATVLRFFYGDSVRSGIDIRSILRRALPAAAVMAALMCLPLVAAPPDQASLDKSIDRTLEQREFSWRMPSDEEPPEAMNWFLRFVKWISDGINDFLEWLGERLRPDRTESGRERAREGAGSSTQYLMIALALVAAGAVLFLYIRGTRRQAEPTVAEATAAVTVDVTDESVLADQLEEDSWLRMADDLIAKGDYRAALRALHLSGLRFLSERRMVSIQRWKSGLEYHDELRRRSRHVPALGESFSSNLRLFELGWYSLHPVEPPMLDEFRRRLGEIRTQAGAP